jgi:murein DD-endopeptidase MepM/ murein hydrolase activator NlpD
MRRLTLLLVLLLAVPASAEPRAGFRWPLAGTPTVDRGFSPPASQWGAGHRGVDLRAQPGQTVLAAGPGRVSYAGTLAGRGVVTVTHDGGLRTTYEPVSASAHVGDAVSAGSVIGRLGTGHASCRVGTSCLHWGLLRGDTYLDPLGLLLPQQVRLLPPDPAPALRPAAAASASSSRRVGGAAAAGGLVLGLTLLASRRRPAPVPPPRPIDLRAERARRRAA